MKPPKGIHRFEESKLAASRLIHLALDHIMFANADVQWDLTIRYRQNEEQAKKSEHALVRVVSSKFSNKPKRAVSGEQEQVCSQIEGSSAWKR